jgi:hypothetical protein
MDLLSDLIAKQPTIMLSSLDALLRSKAVTEAANSVFCRRVYLYNTPPGIHIPELLRMLEVGDDKSWRSVDILDDAVHMCHGCPQLSVMMTCHRNLEAHACTTLVTNST